MKTRKKKKKKFQASDRIRGHKAFFIIDDPLRCRVKACSRGPMASTGLCFDHWARVPIDYRWAIWNNLPGSEAWLNGVADVVEYIERRSK